ncbi:MAG: peptidoglycan recognition protein [Elusimicrobiota bacterium]
MPVRYAWSLAFYLTTSMAAASQTTSPTIITREEWGATAPAFAFNPMPPIYRATIHNTAGQAPTQLAFAKSQMRAIQIFHRDVRGWADIGYHFVIDRAGRIYEGRPLGAVGAHAGPGIENNLGNIGIALMGNYMKYPPTAKQMESVQRLALWLSTAYKIEPEQWKGHIDYNPHKGCPGYFITKQLPKLRAWLSEKLLVLRAEKETVELRKETAMERLLRLRKADSSADKPLLTIPWP